jgi:tripartite-type tricarboxylate transporter receptor subunit TctC
MRIAAISLLSLFLVASPANAAGNSEQPYPNRPIRLIVAFPPGGNVDVYARMLARHVEKQLGQLIVVDNRAGGANGIVGYNLVAKAPPDGYTILDSAYTLAVNPAIYKELPYDTVKDFAPITNFVVGFGYLMTAHPSLPANSVKELIALAKKQQVIYSSAGIGNGQHMSAEWFSMKAGIHMMHVPYKGGGPALNALVAGEVQLQFPSAAPAEPFIKAGKLKGLGFTGKSRVSLLPDVPTIAEAGLPGFEFDAGWHGWFAPAGTPPAIVNRLHAEIRKALQQPQLREYFVSSGYEPKADSPAVFEKIFRADLDKYATIVKVAKIKVE